MGEQNFYLCLFDRKLNKIKEIKLFSNTSNLYTGWGQIHEGVLLFLDDITDQEISKNLELNIFHSCKMKDKFKTVKKDITNIQS